MLPILKNPILPGGLILASAVAVGVHFITGADREFPVPQAGQEVAVLDALERVSSSTPKDWAATADVVVVAKAVRERAHEPRQSETTVESNLIGRTVTVEPIDKVWVSAASAHALEMTPIDLVVNGWLTNNGRTSEVTLGSGSRIEIGHTYLLALVWTPPTCGEDPTPGGWAVIGSAGALPIDGGVVGSGEFEAVVTEAVDANKFEPKSMLSLTAGRSAEDVAKALSAVGPVQRVAFSDPPVKTC